MGAPAPGTVRPGHVSPPVADDDASNLQLSAAGVDRARGTWGTSGRSEGHLTTSRVTTSVPQLAGDMSPLTGDMCHHWQGDMCHGWQGTRSLDEVWVV